MVLAIEEIIAVNEKSTDDLLTPRQAAEVLSRLWQRTFTAKDFINLRLNAQKRAETLNVELSQLFPIDPVVTDTRITMWRKKDIEYLARTIPPPKLREESRKPRPPRKKSS